MLTVLCQYIFCHTIWCCILFKVFRFFLLSIEKYNEINLKLIHLYFSILKWFECNRITKVSMKTIWICRAIIFIHFNWMSDDVLCAQTYFKWTYTELCVSIPNCTLNVSIQINCSMLIEYLIRFDKTKKKC